MALVALTCGLSQSVTVPPAKSLEMQRYNFYHAVCTKLLDEFDGQALSNLGEENSRASILFPAGSSRQMIFIERTGFLYGQPPSPRAMVGIKLFEFKNGKAQPAGEVKFEMGEWSPVPNEGTLRKALRQDGEPGVRLPSRLPPRIEDIVGARQAYACYSFQKIATMRMGFLNKDAQKFEDSRAADAYNKSSGGTWLQKHGFPLSDRERKFIGK